MCVDGEWLVKCKGGRGEVAFLATLAHYLNNKTKKALQGVEKGCACMGWEIRKASAGLEVCRYVC